MVDFKLYLVTNRILCQDVSLEKIVREACGAGVRAVQLREKDLSGKTLYEQAKALRDATWHANAVLLVNDRADIALAVGADGIHCPENGFPVHTARRLFPEGLVGASVHSTERAQGAQTSGADFILFGPIFSTPSKAGYGAPQGLDALAGVAGAVNAPVFAIGGITPENTRLCIEAGAAGIGVMSAILSADNVTRVVAAFEDTLGGL